MGLISREEAIQELEFICENKILSEEGTYALCIALDEMKSNSRPKGKWIKESDYKVMGDGYMWNCSECGNRVYVDSGGVFPNYCGDCGADMKGDLDVVEEESKIDEVVIHKRDCKECSYDPQSGWHYCKKINTIHFNCVECINYTPRR